MTSVSRYGQLRVKSTSKKRLWNPDTKAYLHASGEGESSGSMWSWMGYESQAAKLKERALIRGDDWPYVVVDIWEAEDNERIAKRNGEV